MYNFNSKITHLRSEKIRNLIYYKKINYGDIIIINKIYLKVLDDNKGEFGCNCCFFHEKCIFTSCNQSDNLYYIKANIKEERKIKLDNLQQIKI